MCGSYIMDSGSNDPYLSFPNFFSHKSAISANFAENEKYAYFSKNQQFSKLKYSLERSKTCLWVYKVSLESASTFPTNPQK